MEAGVLDDDAAHFLISVLTAPGLSGLLQVNETAPAALMARRQDNL